MQHSGSVNARNIGSHQVQNLTGLVLAKTPCSRNRIILATFAFSVKFPRLGICSIICGKISEIVCGSITSTGFPAWQTDHGEIFSSILLLATGEIERTPEALTLRIPGSLLSCPTSIESSQSLRLPLIWKHILELSWPPSHSA